MAATHSFTHTRTHANKHGWASMCVHINTHTLSRLDQLSHSSPSPSKPTGEGWYKSLGRMKAEGMHVVYVTHAYTHIHTQTLASSGYLLHTVQPWLDSTYKSVCCKTHLNRPVDRHVAHDRNMHTRDKDSHAQFYVITPMYPKPLMSSRHLRR